MSENSQLLELCKHVAGEDTLWNKVFDTISEAVFIVDKDKNILFFNKRAEQITGYKKSELVGKHCLKGFRCKNCITECTVFKLGKTRDRENEILTKDDRIVPITRNAILLKNADGNILGAVETFRETTKEKQLLDRCKLQNLKCEQQKKAVEAMMDSMIEGVIAIDPEWHIISLSGRATQMIGFTHEEASGQKIGELLNTKLFDQGCSLADVVASKKRCTETRGEITTKEGVVIPVEISAAPLVEKEKIISGGIVLVRDLSAEADLARQLRNKYSFSGIISQSDVMQRIFDLLKRIAVTDTTVLITGESGTGKELIARAIHYNSPRRTKPFITVNCGALPDNLLESELFGHVKGSFTGAIRDHKGRFELADGGTIFLDEIGDMPTHLQVKILRVLQQKVFERIGGTTTISVNLRIVAATNADLMEKIKNNEFREDLYYRLKVVPIHIPALRDRREDIELLAQHFLNTFSAEQERTLKLSPQSFRVLMDYQWPGNVRELENTVQYAVAVCKKSVIFPDDLPIEITQSSPKINNEVTGLSEAEHIQSTLQKCHFNRTKAARMLNMDRTTLWRKMKRYNLLEN